MVECTKNPFAYGTIATGEDFVNRTEEQAQLTRLMRLGESAVLFSPNGLGKSSLLAELARKNSKEFIFVLVNLTGIANEGSLLDILTRETMRAAYGSVETYPPEAWELLMNPRLRHAVVEGVKIGATRKFGAGKLAVSAPRLEKRNEGTGQKGKYLDIRMCPECGRPLKWVEKYSRHYCYSCKKYAPIRRTMKLPIRTSGVASRDELACPKCRHDLRFVHKYSDYYCEKCRKYPLANSKKRTAETPTMADMVEVLDLPEKIANQKATRVVVALDEFQEILTIENPIMLETMRQRFEMHGNVSYIFAGSNKFAMEQTFSEKSSPLSEFADWIDLKPLPDSDLEKYLITKYNSGKGKLSKDAAEIIVGVGGGYPYYTQKIAHELFHISTSPTVRQTEEAVSSVLRHRSAVYSVLWESIRSPLHRKYLLAVANEPRVSHGEEFVRKHGLKSRSHVQRIEKQLEQKGIINDGEVVDPMFVLWLRSTTYA